MKFDWFVLPFTLGLTFVFVVIAIKFATWLIALSAAEKRQLINHLKSKSIIISLREIFYESLLHRKIFKTNPVLGYMHMSLAFGWLLLIAIGNIEIKFYSEYSINPPYVPIFLRFFEPEPTPHFFGRGFGFIMDFLLLFVLSGVTLALIKRFRSRIFGMKKTTTHNLFDRLALSTLWIIFPARLIAESFTSGVYGNGGFLTGTLGNFAAGFLPVQHLAYPAWWLYSTALGLFFVALPFSRYMHIPAEALLIILRNAGLKTGTKISSYSNIEVHSCSRCGICIDSCQLATATNVLNIQPGSFFRDMRNGKTSINNTFNCLMCGRCNTACPVAIKTTSIRQAKRIEFQNHLAYNYIYIKPEESEKTDILYFAGCMSHLTPGVQKAMSEIFNKAGVNWQQLDNNKTICCGRPLLLAGQEYAARELMAKNIELIKKSGAKTLVTSCPICYTAFKNEAQISQKVMHHSQYLHHLIETEKIQIEKSALLAVYHDPCELGRQNNVYLEPRLVINQAATLTENNNKPEKAPCCGSSLGNHLISNSDKNKIAENALQLLGANDANMLVTSCPLCKKAFQQVSTKPVIDIAELIAKQLAVNIPVAISARKPAKEAVSVNINRLN